MLGTCAEYNPLTSTWCGFLTLLRIIYYIAVLYCMTAGTILYMHVPQGSCDGNHLCNLLGANHYRSTLHILDLSARCTVVAAVAGDLLRYHK